LSQTTVINQSINQHVFKARVTKMPARELFITTENFEKEKL